MTSIATPIWNQIAREQHLETTAARIAFSLNDDRMTRMGEIWSELEEKAGISEGTIRLSLRTCLPLLLEGFAIQQYLNQHPGLRSAMPEINSPQEAVSLMTAEWRLTPEEQDQLLKALEDPMSLARWEEAARKAQEEGNGSSPSKSKKAQHLNPPMKFLIAFPDLQALLKNAGMSRPKKTETFILSACASRVFVEFRGVVAGIEMLVLSDGAVELPAHNFPALIKTYKGTRFLNFVGSANGLKIQSFTMPVISWNPRPRPPADFKLFPTMAPPEVDGTAPVGSR